VASTKLKIKEPSIKCYTFSYKYKVGCVIKALWGKN
jgi:hypothetical protein